ncbi:MucR family transcriptional regulator [Methylobacterium trifolii]|uniref:Transcriptional regulatory protein ros n=1 Tax=Methylobacterium trifolii TaxID=1003092 RepID=A0ABQ4U368_9HYPH|nr:MucR family transcriptional regulator [Methylobacterium trifolii]GJE60275.1 Transcriptional regulatory protein ros [Methylobacterium trifolii]
MDAATSTVQIDLIELAIDIVSAYVSNNPVPTTELASLIRTVHASLSNLGATTADEKPAVEKPSAAQIRKSITPEHIFSFEDGKGYKSLRRHLTGLGLTPEAYRTKWSLPTDYPLVSASYSAKRSEISRALHLGQPRKKAAAKAIVAAETVSETPKKQGRPRKAPVEKASE